MKLLSRDFTTKEKILVGVLILILLGFAYYQFLYQPVQERIEAAKSQQQTLQTELDGLNAKIAALEKMQREIDDIIASGSVSVMPSYNSSKEETTLLNDILADASQFAISFSNVKRDGDQIRRTVSLQYTTYDYKLSEWVLQQLTESGYRCLLGDVRFAVGETRLVDTNEMNTIVRVNATATFYETMVGGTVDAGLPAEKK